MVGWCISLGCSSLTGTVRRAADADADLLFLLWSSALLHQDLHHLQPCGRGQGERHGISVELELGRGRYRKNHGNGREGDRAEQCLVGSGVVLYCTVRCMYCTYHGLWLSRSSWSSWSSWIPRVASSYLASSSPGGPARDRGDRLVVCGGRAGEDDVR